MAEFTQPFEPCPWRDGYACYHFASAKEAQTVAPHVRTSSPSRANIGYIVLTTLSIGLGVWPSSSQERRNKLSLLC
jgi:hypothetical protein